MRGALAYRSSRWTVSIENAGRQIAHVLRTAWLGTAVPHPLTRVRDDGLTSADVHGACFVLDAQHPFENDR